MNVDHIPYTFSGSTLTIVLLFVNCFAKALVQESDQEEDFFMDYFSRN